MTYYVPCSALNLNYTLLNIGYIGVPVAACIPVTGLSIQASLAALAVYHTGSLWQMQFNISKCAHLPITNKTKPNSHQYSLFGHPLSKVASHAYLGVKLDSKLSWAKYITEITTKSSKVLGMVKRTLGPCEPEVKDTAYSMLVRPKLESMLNLFGTHIQAPKYIYRPTHTITQPTPIHNT